MSATQEAELKDCVEQLVPPSLQTEFTVKTVELAYSMGRLKGMSATDGLIQKMELAIKLLEKRVSELTSKNADLVGLLGKK